MPLISITFFKMLKVIVGNENMSFMKLNLLSHNSCCSVGVMEICLLNLFILIDCFLCNSYPCVLIESLSHVIDQESHVSEGNLGSIYLVHFLEFSNLPRFTREIS